MPRAEGGEPEDLWLRALDSPLLAAWHRSPPISSALLQEIAALYRFSQIVMLKALCWAKRSALESNFGARTKRMHAHQTDRLNDHHQPEALRKLVQRLQAHIARRTGGIVRNLRVEFHAGCCVLHGEATNYHVKQMAQAVAMTLKPADQLDNRITVSHSDGSDPLAEKPAKTIDANAVVVPNSIRPCFKNREVKSCWS